MPNVTEYIIHRILRNGWRKIRDMLRARRRIVSNVISKIVALIAREKEEGSRVRGDLIFLMNVKCCYDRYDVARELISPASGTERPLGN